MKRVIQFVQGPLPRVEPPGWPEAGEAGAIVDFYGVVRRSEKGTDIPGLHYEAYETMAFKEFHRILDALEIQYPCLEIHLIHSLDFVPTGEASLHVRVKGRHRAEAFGLAESLINEMKRDVPIWKIAPRP
jgi:molybdopterin synthase catalytic subunit